MKPLVTVCELVFSRGRERNFWQFLLSVSLDASSLSIRKLQKGGGFLADHRFARDFRVLVSSI